MNFILGDKEVVVEKVFVAKRVAAKLRGTEHSIDAALVETSQMMADLLGARKALKLAANVGNDVVSKVATAMAALTEARTAMVEAHAELAGVQAALDIRMRTENVENKGEPETADLREVA
jgi:hypothetical protein